MQELPQLLYTIKSLETLYGGQFTFYFINSVVRTNLLLNLTFISTAKTLAPFVLCKVNLWAKVSKLCTLTTESEWKNTRISKFPNYMYRYITNKYYQNEIVLFKLLNDKLMYKIIQKYDTETWHLQRAQFNPLHPNISMHILPTVLYTFPKRLTRRISLTIKSCFSWWSSSLLSQLSCLIQGWYCKEKLDASHS